MRSTESRHPRAAWHAGNNVSAGRRLKTGNPKPCAGCPETRNPGPKTGNRKPKTLRGQVWGFDFLFASFILSVILILYLLTWQYLGLVSSQALEGSELLKANLAATNSLVFSPGDPANWNELATINESTVHSIGIVDERNVINERKVQTMAALNATHYELFKDYLGISKHEFQMQLKAENGSVLYVVGMAPGTENETSSLERVALLNGSMVRVVMEVWE